MFVVLAFPPLREFYAFELPLRRALVIGAIIAGGAIALLEIAWTSRSGANLARNGCPASPCRIRRGAAARLQPPATLEQGVETGESNLACHVSCGCCPGTVLIVSFRDRADAGRRLGAAVAARDLEAPVVLALPRGGVPVGAEVARRFKPRST